MRVEHPTPDQALVTWSPAPQLAWGLGLAAAGGGVLALCAARVAGDGGAWVGVAVGGMFALFGGLLVWTAAGGTAVVDRAAGRCVLTRRRLFGRAPQVEDFALADVADAALEDERRDMPTPGPTRPVLVLADGTRRPWRDSYHADHAAQARAVAALRHAAGWQALPAADPPPSSTSPDPSPRATAGCLRAVAALFALPALGLTGLQLYRLAAYRPVPATVYAAFVDASRGSRGSTSYAPVVRYQYAVGGRPYQAERVLPLGFRRGGIGAERWAEGVVAPYRPGARVTAYVSPRDPTAAFLTRDVALWPLAGVLVPVGLYLLVARAARRQQRDPAAFAAPAVPVLPRAA